MSAKVSHDLAIVATHVISVHVHADGNVTDETLLDDATELVNIESRSVPILVRVLVDLETVGPVAGTSPLVLDRVLRVRVNLVNDGVELIGNEELPSVNNATGSERAVLEWGPLGVNFGVNVGGAASVVTGEDGC